MGLFSFSGQLCCLFPMDWGSTLTITMSLEVFWWILAFWFSHTITVRHRHWRPLPKYYPKKLFSRKCVVLSLIKVILRLCYFIGHGCIDLNFYDFVLVGHGTSSGTHSHVGNLTEYTKLIFDHCDEMKKNYPDLPIFLFGHSIVQ